MRASLNFRPSLGPLPSTNAWGTSSSQRWICSGGGNTNTMKELAWWLKAKAEKKDRSKTQTCWEHFLHFLIVVNWDPTICPAVEAMYFRVVLTQGFVVEFLDLPHFCACHEQGVVHNSMTRVKGKKRIERGGRGGAHCRESGYWMRCCAVMRASCSRWPVTAWISLTLA